MRYSPSPSEFVRSARAELDCIAASMRAADVARLVVLGRQMLETSDARHEANRTHDDAIAVND